MAVDAIIFDLDGTIIDTESPDFWSWEPLYQRYSIPLTTQLWEKRVGSVGLAGFDPRHYLEQLAGITLSQIDLDEQYRRYIEGCEHQQLLPGVLNVLKGAQAQGIKLGVASNSERDWVERWLNFHQLTPYFQQVLTRDEVTDPKPAPEIYLKSAAELGVPVERCIAVEDSPTGIRAVLAAGIRCVAVLNPVTQNIPLPEGIALKLNSLADLDFPSLLGRF